MKYFKTTDAGHEEMTAAEIADFLRIQEAIRLEEAAQGAIKSTEKRVAELEAKLVALEKK